VKVSELQIAPSPRRWILRILSDDRSTLLQAALVGAKIVPMPLAYRWTCQNRTGIGFAGFRRSALSDGTLLSFANYRDTLPKLETRPNMMIRIVPLSLYYAGLNSSPNGVFTSEEDTPEERSQNSGLQHLSCQQAQEGESLSVLAG
jgi:hypothetical protein